MQGKNLATVTKEQTHWNSINWKKANRNVRNLRQRIFRATQENDLKKVRSLQKLMLKSYSNRLVTVRRITQINQGKHTAGVDKVTVKTPKARGQLVDKLTAIDVWKALPTRRIYIPKKNGKKRPLSIPVIMDRCLQNIVKNALEPHWENKFEGTSYGFRPGRSCQDAIGKIFRFVAKGRKQWILDADISGAFDNISHNHLRQSVGNFPARGLINQWLKAGYIEDGTRHRTESGTPQGSVISPLLCNIALHGMEDAIGVKYRNHSKRGRSIHPTCTKIIVRYADDFVILCDTQSDAVEAKETIKQWLAERGLELSEEKTNLTHIEKGIDFLGFNIRRYRLKRGIHKTLIKPSKESISKVKTKLREQWRSLKNKDVKIITRRLNPLIKGWANYYRSVVSSKTFETLDTFQFQRETRYVNHKHPNKSKKWKREKYWGKLNPKRGDKWVFGDTTPLKWNLAYDKDKISCPHVTKFRWVEIRRHVLVKDTASPDDPQLKKYWERRMKAGSTQLTESYQKIADRQRGKCPICNESLFNGEEIQKHHILPTNEGGTETYKNLQLVHYFCHQQLHG